eukprot:GILI01009734.1.p1 GENE.GILI01009734.1~~GILI01009734.1.p1  ORF type:complete len:716 (+),score=162.28 GILI01009734.1:87-2234(+)
MKKRPSFGDLAAFSRSPSLSLLLLFLSLSVLLSPSLALRTHARASYRPSSPNPLTALLFNAKTKDPSPPAPAQSSTFSFVTQNHPPSKLLPSSSAVQQQASPSDPKAVHAFRSYARIPHTVTKEEKEGAVHRLYKHSLQMIHRDSKPTKKPEEPVVAAVPQVRPHSLHPVMTPVSTLDQLSKDRMLFFGLCAGSALCLLFLVATWGVFSEVKCVFPSVMLLWVFLCAMATMALMLVSYFVDFESDMTWCKVQAVGLTYFVHAGFMWLTMFSLTISRLVTSIDLEALQVQKSRINTLNHCISWLAPVPFTLAMVGLHNHIAPYSCFCWLEEPIWIRSLLLHAPLALESTLILIWMLEVCFIRFRPIYDYLDADRARQFPLQAVVRIVVLCSFISLSVLGGSVRRMYDTFNNDASEDHVVNIIDVGIASVGFFLFFCLGVTPDNFRIWKSTLICGGAALQPDELYSAKLKGIQADSLPLPQSLLKGLGDKDDKAAVQASRPRVPSVSAAFASAYKHQQTARGKPARAASLSQSAPSSPSVSHHSLSGDVNFSSQENDPSPAHSVDVAVISSLNAETFDEIEVDTQQPASKPTHDSFHPQDPFVGHVPVHMSGWQTGQRKQGLVEKGEDSPSKARYSVTKIVREASTSSFLGTEASQQLSAHVPPLIQYSSPSFPPRPTPAAHLESMDVGVSSLSSPRTSLDSRPTDNINLGLLDGSQ